MANDCALYEVIFLLSAQEIPRTCLSICIDRLSSISANKASATKGAAVNASLVLICRAQRQAQPEAVVPSGGASVPENKVQAVGSE